MRFSSETKPSGKRVGHNEPGNLIKDFGNSANSVYVSLATSSRYSPVFESLQVSLFNFNTEKQEKTSEAASKSTNHTVKLHMRLMLCGKPPTYVC